MNVISRVLSIKDRGEMLRFAEWYIEQLVKDTGVTPEYALKVARSNIGWCYGEGMKPELIKAWNEVTGAVHPLSGMNVYRPFKESFELGQKFAKGEIKDLNFENDQPLRKTTRAILEKKDLTT